MRNENQRKRFKIILLILGLIVVILLLGLLGLEFIKKAKITNFEIKTNNLTCTESEKITQFLKESNLHYFAFRQDQLTKDLKKKFFCIGKVETKLSYPDKLWLEVWGREALFAITEVQTSLALNPAVILPEDFQEATDSTQTAAVNNLNEILSDLKLSSESGTFLVDKEGMVFEQVSGLIDFPQLSILGQKLEVGKQVMGDAIEKAQMITQKLAEIETPSDSIIIIGDKLVVNSKPRIIFSLKKRLDYQTASLQLILAQAKMNSDPQFAGNRNIESIDLRFNKPVVVYGKSSK